MKQPFPMGMIALAVVLIVAEIDPLIAADASSEVVAVDPPRIATDVISPADWSRVDATVDRALQFLSSKQRTDGSFEGPPNGQPGITGLCVLAFLSRGHLPNQGPYGESMNRAIEFVLANQRRDGLFSFVNVEQDGDAAHAALYNHGIAGLMLCETYGMTQDEQQERIRTGILKGISFTKKHQKLVISRGPRRDRGGWRYYGPSSNNSDVSATAWQLMFLRSARNAEFEVPKHYIDEAMNFIRRCFDPRTGAFVYRLSTPTANGGATGTRVRGGVVGGGIVALSLGGEHNSEMAQHAGKWILNYDFQRYNRTPHFKDRYHYSAFYCSQAMFQLGGEYWEKFYPKLMNTLVANQHPDGSWDPEATRDTAFGNIYTSALTVLALTPPYQLLPIYQR